MNSKKHKNKNRPKANPLPPQKDRKNVVEVLTKCEDILSEKKLEDEVKNEEIVQQKVEVKEVMNIEKEENLDVMVQSLSECLTEDSPVKPKRNKGKKKKHAIAIESEQESKVEERKEVEIVQKEDSISENKLIENTAKEQSEIQPSARKKKTKSKKQVHLSTEDATESKSDAEFSHPEDSKAEFIEGKNEDGLKSEVIVSSKKNKKKKHRHDSEKSDKAEEPLLCTAAFKQLIDETDDKNNLIEPAEEVKEDDSRHVSKIDLTTSVEAMPEPDLGKTLNTKSNKKKKKEKKFPPKVKDDIHDLKDVTKEVVPGDSNQTTTGDDKVEISSKELKQATLVIEEIKDLPQSSPTPDIMLPKSDDIEVPKSLYTKSEVPVLENSNDLIQNLKEDSLNKTLRQSDSLKKNVLDIRDSNIKKEEDIICKETFKEPIIILENAEDFENNERVQGSANESFSKQVEEKKEVLLIEAEISKNVSDDFDQQEPKINKSENDSDKNKVDESIKIDQLSEHTPDFIQIPRSSSQQLLDDNNNNTVIQEITLKDELKLGIPVLTSSMIQGSGETPISTPKDITSDITVTELESIPIQEKTDLKSKMMEVNQDLEELKMSLEKSLAELSIIDKSDLNINEEKTSQDVIHETKENTKQPTNDPDEKGEVYKPLADRLCEIENKFTLPEVKLSENSSENQTTVEKSMALPSNEMPPICPSRKDRKGKNKSKKKGKREPETTTTQASTVSSTSASSSQSPQIENKTEEKAKNSEEKGKQQAGDATKNAKQQLSDLQFEPIENFEDALSSSVDDVDINKTFEMIASELNKEPVCEPQQRESNLVYPEINITPPFEDVEREKQQKNVNPVSQPKNLLGRPNIPVQSNKTDYKKEKNKNANFKQAKVKIKDSVDIEKKTSQSQTDNKLKRLNDKNEIESYSYVTNEKEEYVYKYSFRKVFLTNVCLVCRKDLQQSRIPCKFCNLVFYCNQKHKDEDWPKHQNLCFAVSTIVHLKDQKHIYADAKNVSGQNYRLIRMQMILSCEKVLKRKLLPWEQEALLYPRICADVQCREWNQSKLSDCEGCGQLSYCTDHPEHLPLSHQRWCKSYALYQKLVMYQQLNGRLAPKMPGMVMAEDFVIPDKINEVLASMYEEKIDMSDIQYAALTQVATAPLTTGYGYQLYRQSVNSSNGLCKRSTFTVHVVGAELQFEADSLNKWEVFLLHLRPDVKDLRVALLGVELNPSNLPLNILGNIKLCGDCRSLKRRVQFSFQDKMTYHDYWASDDFVVPDIVCVFNPSIQRSSMYHGSETWISTINCILKQKVPFLITSYTLEELSRDLECVKNYAEVDFKVIAGPRHNPFASVRPDRNFISDDETPLLFKNYCYSIICGV